MIKTTLWLGMSAFCTAIATNITQALADQQAVQGTCSSYSECQNVYNVRCGYNVIQSTFNYQNSTGIDSATASANACAVSKINYELCGDNNHIQTIWSFSIIYSNSACPTQTVNAGAAGTTNYASPVSCANAGSINPGFPNVLTSFSEEIGGRPIVAADQGYWQTDQTDERKRVLTGIEFTLPSQLNSMVATELCIGTCQVVTGTQRVYFSPTSLAGFKSTIYGLSAGISTWNSPSTQAQNTTGGIASLAFKYLEEEIIFPLAPLTDLANTNYTEADSHVGFGPNEYINVQSPKISPNCLMGDVQTPYFKVGWFNQNTYNQVSSSYTLAGFINHVDVAYDQGAVQYQANYQCAAGQGYGGIGVAISDTFYGVYQVKGNWMGPIAKNSKIDFYTTDQFVGKDQLIITLANPVLCGITATNIDGETVPFGRYYAGDGTHTFPTSCKFSSSGTLEGYPAQFAWDFSGGQGIKAMRIIGSEYIAGSGSSLGAGAIAGIVIGLLLAGAIVVVGIAYCRKCLCFKAKAHEAEAVEQLYTVNDEN